MRKNVITPIAAGILLAAAGTASAATRTTTFGVSANVAANCLVSASPMSFGDYDGTAPRPGSSDISVRCSNGAPYTLALNVGTTTGASFAQRLLAFGTNTLEYNLYTSSAYTSIWGDGVGGSTATVTGTGTGMSNASIQTRTVYGELVNSVANQDAPVGSYSDTITVTIEY